MSNNPLYNIYIVTLRNGNGRESYIAERASNRFAIVDKPSKATHFDPDTAAARKNEYADLLPHLTVSVLVHVPKAE